MSQFQNKKSNKTHSVTGRKKDKIVPKNYIETNKSMMKLQSLLNSKPVQTNGTNISERINIFTTESWRNPDNS
jgi:hypothetical protein